MTNPGMVLGGRYLLQERVGSGGMGTVWRALDQVLERPVAVKTLQATVRVPPADAVRRFQVESRAAAQLDDTHVVAVHDFGIVQDEADGTVPYLVMQLVEGRTLAELLRAEGRLPAERAVGIARQVCRGIGAVHRAGVIHRDIKPSNIMLTEGDDVKVMDFGIAKFAEDTTRLTPPGSGALGTTAYMAPERFANQPPAASADLYSMGCLLYEMLAGRKPFHGTDVALMRQHADAEPRPLDDLCHDLPSGLSGLVTRMLAKEPEERPDAREAERVLAAVSARATAPVIDPMGSVPVVSPGKYRTQMPSWAFVGTSGGVGKTTLAMMTAELLAESGNTVLYLDADIAHFGGTSEWCQRARAGVRKVRTFADHVAAFSRARSAVPAGDLSDGLIDVTPDYLRRHGCGKILLLPAARASDKLFVFELVAEIKDSRSNEVCREILDTAFDRGISKGATCVVIDCGAQFDPLAVNCLAAAHHPVVVAAARAGAKDQRETILANCAQTVDDFNRMSVETVVNRVPSREALIQHWGDPGYGRPGMNFHHLPFDPKLFQDWEEGRPHFELGYDELSKAWHDVLVASDANNCDGLHRAMLPQEWDRFSKWALWLVDNPGWAEARWNALGRAVRRSYAVTAGLFAGLAAALTSMLLHLFAADGEGPGRSDPSFLPQWSAVTLVAVLGLLLVWNVLARGLTKRRRRVMAEVMRHSSSAEGLRTWFTALPEEGPWWQVWRRSRRAAIEWLHRQVVAERAALLTPRVAREAVQA
ncbi:protein kinase [Streptomyces sp. NPDC048172]|uniref:protein kinase domain-containing protein n=1 Tax=Streptomyces sp. NPDC048172 TaxID=3365505 RepID=UPI00371574CD